MTNIKPMFDYLLIEPLEETTKLPSGIIVPDTAKEKPQKGKIISAGPGKKDESGNTIEMTLKTGDIVMYKKWGGTEIKIERKDYLLVKEEDVLAIYKDGGKK